MQVKMSSYFQEASVQVQSHLGASLEKIADFVEAATYAAGGGPASWRAKD